MRIDLIRSAASASFTFSPLALATVAAKSVMFVWWQETHPAFPKNPPVAVSSKVMPRCTAGLISTGAASGITALFKFAWTAPEFFSASYAAVGPYFAAQSSALSPFTSLSFRSVPFAIKALITSGS